MLRPRKILLPDVPPPRTGARRVSFEAGSPGSRRRSVRAYRLYHGDSTGSMSSNRLAAMLGKKYLPRLSETLLVQLWRSCWQRD